MSKQTGSNPETYPVPTGGPEPAVDTGYTILYRDEHLLAINKPARLPCHPGGRYLHNTLIHLLRRDLSPADPVLAHRLDRETSGVLLLALNRQTGARLYRQFANRTVKKHYEVFVEGVFPPTLLADGYLMSDPDSVVRKRRRFAQGLPITELPPDAERAITRFTCLASDGEISHVMAKPETGRLHQIRATLHSLGFPVIGDTIYGVDANLFLKFCADRLDTIDRQRLRIARQALHAASIRCIHPATGEIFSCHAPLPTDLQTLAMRIERKDGITNP
jgi:RluA family pseudouridine synthase